MSQGPEHQDKRATAHRPFINLDDDSKGVYVVTIKLYNDTVYYFLNIFDDKNVKKKFIFENNIMYIFAL